DPEAGDLVLDWRVIDKNIDPRSRIFSILVNDVEVSDARFISEHIVIPRAHLKTGANTIDMIFASPVSASGSAVTRYLDREDNSEYVYSLFVPSDASTTFPCFDQPDLKARFTLGVVAPKDWHIVTNTGPDTEFEAGPRYEPREGVLHHRFLETEPLSTYQFAFAAGPFAEFKDESSPYKTRLFVRKSKAERARKELSDVFLLTRGGLNFRSEERRGGEGRNGEICRAAWRQRALTHV